MNSACNHVKSRKADEKEACELVKSQMLACGGCKALLVVSLIFFAAVRCLYSEFSAPISKACAAQEQINVFDYHRKIIVRHRSSLWKGTIRHLYLPILC